MESLATNGRIRLVLAFLMLTILASLAQPVSAAPPRVGRNFLVTFDSANSPQTEPSVAIHPGDSKIMVIGANDLRLFEGPFLPSGWAGIYRSTDSGRTWFQSLIPGFPGDNSPEGLASPLRDFQLFFDAVVAFDSIGNLYYAGIVLNTAPGVGIKDGTLFLSKYVGGGAFFESTVIVRRGSGQSPFVDKPWLFIDRSNDNIYLSWTEFIGFSETRIMFTRSTDGGQTFSEPIQLSAPLKAEDGSFVEFAQCSWISGGSGNVHLVWKQFGLAGSQPSRIVYSRSVDGGQTFTSPRIVAELNVPSFFNGGFALTGDSFRTPCGHSVAADETGTSIFIVWNELNNSGDLDLRYTVSTDAGTTFNPPKTLNDVTVNDQFDASADISRGRIHVAWYDARFDDGGTIEKLDVFYATSDNFGQSFSKNLRVTSNSFNPSIPVYLGQTAAFVGDYFGLDAEGSTVQVAWTDNGNVGPQSPRNSDILTARVTL